MPEGIETGALRLMKNVSQQKASTAFKLSLGSIRQRLLGIAPEEASFARRGFSPGHARERLELIGVVFLRGYQLALEETDPRGLAARLNQLDAESRGFAFEGAAMALALLDLMTPWKKHRWLYFMQSGGAKHIYMSYVGVGWALARLQRWRAVDHPQLTDPLLRWLAMDGYGFHEGYFHWPKFIRNRALPGRLSGYSRRVFDQGLGRSLWFVNGADVQRIAATIATFPVTRRADLWSGVGLACAYAGGVDQSALTAMRAAAAPLYQAQLAQGVSFAAKTRQRAGNLAEHTEMACRILCGISAAEAALVTDHALKNLPYDCELPAYEIWRQRIQARFSSEVT
jgi:hypothetical protein